MTRGRRVTALGALAGLAVTGMVAAPAFAAVFTEDAPSDSSITLFSGDPGGALGAADWTIDNYWPIVDQSCEFSGDGLSAGEGYWYSTDDSASDAFDGGLIFFVAGEQVVAPEMWSVEYEEGAPVLTAPSAESALAPEDAIYRAVTSGPMGTGNEAVDAVVEYRAMPGSPVLRTVLTLTNSGDGAATVPVNLQTNVGADSSNVVTGTSDGDTDLESTDGWVVTADDTVSPSDPPVSHVLQGPGVVQSPVQNPVLEVFDCSDTDGVGADYSVSVPAGSSRSLMFFNQLSGDNETAISSAARFNDPSSDPELLTGLDLGSIVNWNLADAPPPPPTDTIEPTSSATGPATDDDGSFDISFTADDLGGSGLASVTLWVKEPGAADFEPVSSDLSGAEDGTFTYEVEGGNGEYAYYTRALDGAGNAEVVSGADDTTVVDDGSTPNSEATSPANSRRTTFEVGYEATDAESVELFVKAPGAASYAPAGTDDGAGVDGAFEFTASEDGDYAFYTVATDDIGTVEAAPASPDTTTSVDTVAPLVESLLDAPVVLGADMDTMKLKMTVSERARDSFVIRDEDGVRRRISLGMSPAGKQVAVWDGTGKGGNRLPEGRYLLVMRAKDAAGNVGTVSQTLRVR